MIKCFSLSCQYFHSKIFRSAQLRNFWIIFLLSSLFRNIINFLNCEFDETFYGFLNFVLKLLYSVASINDQFLKIKPIRKVFQKYSVLIGSTDFCKSEVPLKIGFFSQNLGNLVIFGWSFDKIWNPRITRFPGFCKVVQVFRNF
jgi:hypothetical protein